MMHTRKIYIVPTAKPIRFRQPLLYAVSGENQEWGAKEANPDFDYEEEEMRVKQAFIINW